MTAATDTDDTPAAFLSLVKSAPPLDDAAAWAERDERARTEREREERQARESRAEYLEGLGFPRRALDVAIAPATNAPAIERLRGWNPSRHSIVVLEGPVGCGKTVAATWWALHTSIRGIRFLRANAFGTSLRNEKASRELLQAPALVLDDLGAEFIDTAGHYLAALDELVDVLYSAGRPLIVTTNVRREHFGDRYGLRFEDRIGEAGRWVSLAGAPSLRRATSRDGELLDARRPPRPPAGRGGG